MLAVVGQLVDLRGVVQEGADQQLVASSCGYRGATTQHQLHQAHDVLQQPALVGVVVLHRRRRPAELVHERFVVDERLHQPLQRRRLDVRQDLDQPVAHPLDVGRLQRHEVRLAHLVGPRPADAVGDHLHVALEQLRRAVDLHEVAVLERRGSRPRWRSTCGR